MKETSFSPKGECVQRGQGGGGEHQPFQEVAEPHLLGDTSFSSSSLLPASAAGNQPSSHGQPGPLQRQSLRERNGAGESRHRDVQQNPAGPAGGVRAHGKGEEELGRSGLDFTPE